jgi:RND family efflux transporter MFP subunit
MLARVQWIRSRAFKSNQEIRAMINYRLSVVLLSAVFMGVDSIDEAKAPQLPEGPNVMVAKPIERMVTDFQDFTGRAVPAAQVEIRARVTGHILQTPFKEGALVKKGDLLFEIDSRLYQAQLDKALSRLALDQAILKRAKTTLDRDQATEITTPGAISRQQLDLDMASLNEADARIKNSTAEVELAKLNLEWTKVTAPIDGRVGRRLLDAGNLAIADSSVLTSLIHETPIYVYFSIDERTFLHLRRSEDAAKPESKTPWPVRFGLANEVDFPRPGKVTLFDSRVDPENGTIRVRAEYLDPKPAPDNPMPIPGMFVRVRLFADAPYKAQMVVDEAVLADQGLHYVYVIDADYKVQYRRVLVGQSRGDGLRAIKQGLSPDDFVAIRGLKGLRPGLAIQPEKVDMPAAATPASSNQQR